MGYAGTKAYQIWENRSEHDCSKIDLRLDTIVGDKFPDLEVTQDTYLALTADILLFTSISGDLSSCKGWKNAMGV